MKKILVLGLGIALLSGACTQKEIKSPFEGVWKITEASFTSPDTSWMYTSPQPSLFIFAKTYYSQIIIDGTEPRPLLPDSINQNTITDETFRKIFFWVRANSGKYELNESKITIRPMVALWPNGMREGYSEEWEFRISSDTIYLNRTFKNGAARKYTLVLLEH